MSKFIIIIRNAALILFVIISTLHALQGDVLSKIWLLMLVVFWLSSLIVIVLYFIGIIRNYFNKLTSDTNDDN